MRLFLFYIFSAALTFESGAALRVKALRYFQIDGVDHEMAFYSTTQPFDFPAFAEVATLGLPISPDDLLETELKADEEWKFKYFDERGNFKADRDAPLIGSVRTYEALLAHDDVVVIRRIPDLKKPSKKNTVGILALKHQSLDSMTLLLEDRQKLSLSAAGPADFKVGTPFLPPHWRTFPSYQDNLLKRWGGYLQVNSLVTDSQYRIRYLSYLIIGAYWHGLFTNGPIVPANTEYLGETHPRTIQYVPRYYVLEGYDSKKHLSQLFGFKPIPLNSQIQIPDYHQPNRTFSLMGVNFPRFWDWTHRNLNTNRGFKLYEKAASMGWLTFLPADVEWIKAPAPHPIHPWAEFGFMECPLALLKASSNRSISPDTWFPFDQDWTPTLTSVRQ